MNSKLLLLLFSTVALTVATPGIVYSQQPLPAPPQQERFPAPPPQAKPSGEEPSAAPQSKLDEQQEALATALKLTSEQRRQFQEIQDSLQVQIKYILTPEQQAKALALGDSTQNNSALNLSPEQQQKIQEAEGSAKIRFLTLLTPEQLGALNQLMQSSRRSR